MTPGHRHPLRSLHLRLISPACRSQQANLRRYARPHLALPCCHIGHVGAPLGQPSDSSNYLRVWADGVAGRQDEGHNVSVICPGALCRVQQPLRLSGQATFRGSVKLHLVPTEACSTNIAIIVSVSHAVGSNCSTYTVFGTSCSLDVLTQRKIVDV